GRKSVFIVTVGHECSEHEVRQCSIKERICYTGSQRQAKHLDKLKERNEITKIGTNIPSPKTVASEELVKYVKYALTFIDSLFGFYSEKSAPFRDSMKNKDTVKIKGLQSGDTGLLRKKIIQRSKKIQVTFVDISEYNSSQAFCNSCMEKNLKTIVKIPYGWLNITVLVYKHCGTVRNRDVNASKNMLYIAIWKKFGRPIQFKSANGGFLRYLQ
ncbi:hypothetical protein K501DRAFT_178963, partial [Backusella circina FSU 941]